MMDPQEKSDLVRSLRELDSAETVVTAISNIVGRYIETKDPVLRYTLFLDKFLIAFDIIGEVLVSNMGPFSTKFDNMDMTKLGPEEAKRYSEYCSRKERLNEKINTITHSTRIELTKLMEYVQRDLYAPDHRAGEIMLSDAKEDFDKRNL